MILNLAVGEETGLRGAKITAFQIEPDLAIALEGTIGADVPGVSEKRQPVKMGEGGLDDFEPAVNLITELINCLPNAL